LSWQENLNAESYLVEVSTSPTFSSIAYSSNVINSNFNVNGLLSETVYYWRVRPDNNCGNGNYSETFSFKTGEKICASVSQTTPTTITDLSTVTSTINFPDTFTIEDVNLTVDYDHTWIGDVSLTLISPSGTRVTVIDVLTCTTELNFNFNFDDEATNAIDCEVGNTNYPALHTYKPVSPLSAFNGETSNGVWTLEITDDGPEDVGTVNGWALEICEYIQGTLNLNEFELGNLLVWPNPTSETINIKLSNNVSNSDVHVNLYDIQGRTIQRLTYKTNSNTFIISINLNKVESGIYLLEIKQGNKKTTKKIIIN